MEGFDREALVKSSQARQRSGAWFWAAVAVLPVAGIAAGLALGVMPMGGADKPVMIAEQPAAAVVSAPAPAPERVAATAPGFSALAELRRYDMVVRTLRHCANVGPSAHYLKASETYRNTNFGKTGPLREIAQNEPPEYDLSAFEKPISTNPAEIMVQGMTGQIAMNALQRANQFETMMDEIERQSQGYLGEAPSAAECTTFRNEVIMGKHNLTLPPAG